MSQFVQWSQEWIKAMLPAPVLARVRVYRHNANVRRFEAGRREQQRQEWRAMLRNWAQQAEPVRPAAEAAQARHRVLVFPSDPGAIVGSRGDDAMIAAVVQAARSAAPGVEIDMFVDGGGHAVASDMGFRPLPLPADREFPAAVARLLAGNRYDSYVALGADIVDGRFGPRIPALMLIAADLAARSGVRSSILGCSFGEEPARELKAVFRRVDPRVRFNIRDPISLRRVQAFAPVQTRLVADAAFALQPGQADARAAAWIEAQRAAGRRVVGINVHAMLVRNPDAAWVEAMAASLARALGEVAASRDVSWILVPHDYRENFGDLACLERLHALLQERPDVPAYLLRGVHSAADLKALVGRTDGVITGRMHLAIAALGMRVPVLGLTYHDKFEGLFRHFELPPSFLLSPAIFADPADLARRTEAFVDALPALASVIERRHAAVMRLAQQNFLDESPAQG